MTAFLDARTLPENTTLETDVAIIGGGPAGITLALALSHLPINILIVESGGTAFDSKTQALYSGTETGVKYLTLEACRLRYLGGASNHWGGWCRPLDDIDFEERSWLPHSGWPFGLRELKPYLLKAQAWTEVGPFIYDEQSAWTKAMGAPIALGKGGVDTCYFQFSRMRGSVLPTNFSERYAGELKKAQNIKTLLHANVTGVRLAANATSVDHLDIATLSGRKFTVKPKYTVVAAGGIESARILLASKDVVPQGVGNTNDLVGRFFADHPIPRDTAIMVLFGGGIASYYPATQQADGALFRATFSPNDGFRRASNILGSLTTVENNVPLDALGQAAVATTASAMGVDASNVKSFSLGCGFELSPDPDRRLTLIEDRDALGMPKLNLHMTLPDADIARYRATLVELGRQLLVSRAGMIHINHSTRQSWLNLMDWGNHHMGTLRMNDDPKKGVVDANAKVHGIGNLYVAGSSIFPTYSASNPTLNLVATTLRLADTMKGLFA